MYVLSRILTNCKRITKNTTLAQLAVREGKLLASFQIGERISDIRVFVGLFLLMGPPLNISTTGVKGILNCLLRLIFRGGQLLGIKLSMADIPISILPTPYLLIRWVAILRSKSKTIPLQAKVSTVNPWRMPISHWTTQNFTLPS